MKALRVDMCYQGLKLRLYNRRMEGKESSCYGEAVAQTISQMACIMNQSTDIGSASNCIESQDENQYKRNMYHLATFMG